MDSGPNQIAKELRRIRNILLIIAALLFSLLLEISHAAGIATLVVLGLIALVVVFVRLILSVGFEARIAVVESEQPETLR